MHEFYQNILPLHSFQTINFVTPIRMSPSQEWLGADFNEHDIRHDGYDYEAMIAELKRQGHKLHSPRTRSLARSEWDEYLLNKYINSQQHWNAWSNRPSKELPKRNGQRVVEMWNKCIIS